MTEYVDHKRRELLEKPESLRTTTCPETGSVTVLRMRLIGQSAAEPLSHGEGSETIPNGSTPKRVEALRPGDRHDIVRAASEKSSGVCPTKNVAPSWTTTLDEYIAEFDINEYLQPQCRALADCMVAGMESICKYVKVRVEYALMLNWDKNAKPVFGEDGELLRLWTPDIMVPDPANPTALLPLSTFPKKRKEELDDWKKSRTRDQLLSGTPTQHRALFEHGGKKFVGYQPLSSVPDARYL